MLNTIHESWKQKVLWVVTLFLKAYIIKIQTYIRKKEKNSTFSKCCRKRCTDFASGDIYHVPCPSPRQSAPGRICPCSGQWWPPAPGRWDCSCPRDPSVSRAATDPWRGTGTTQKILILSIVKVSSSVTFSDLLVGCCTDYWRIEQNEWMRKSWLKCWAFVWVNYDRRLTLIKPPSWRPQFGSGLSIGGLKCLSSVYFPGVEIFADVSLWIQVNTCIWQF